MKFITFPKLPKMQAQLSFWPISDLENFSGSALGIFMKIHKLNTEYFKYKGSSSINYSSICKLTISFHSPVKLLTIMNPIFLSFYFLSVDDVWIKICWVSSISFLIIKCKMPYPLTFMITPPPPQKKNHEQTRVTDCRFPWMFDVRRRKFINRPKILNWFDLHNECKFFQKDQIKH